MTAAPPQGWYQDPQNPQGLRYWDGSQWTSHTHVPTPPPAPVPVPAHPSVATYQAPQAPAPAAQHHRRAQQHSAAAAPVDYSSEGRALFLAVSLSLVVLGVLVAAAATRMGLAVAVALALYIQRLRAGTLTKRLDALWVEQRQSGSLRIVLGQYEGRRLFGVKVERVQVVVEQGLIYISDSTGTETVDGRSVHWDAVGSTGAFVSLPTRNGETRRLLPYSGLDAPIGATSSHLIAALRESVAITSGMGPVQQPPHF